MTATRLRGERSVPEHPARQHRRRYAVLFEPEDDGRFTVICPSLPGVVTFGETKTEARELVADAIILYLDTLADLGRPIPADDAVDAGQDWVEVAFHRE